MNPYESYKTQHEREMAEYNALPVAPYTTVKISARRWIVVQLVGSSRNHQDPYRTRTVTVPEEARQAAAGPDRYGWTTRTDKAQQLNYNDATQLARDLNQAWWAALQKKEGH